MTKFTSICAVSQFLLLFCSSNGLWCWANGPIRVDLGVTWLAKWRGMDHSARGLCCGFVLLLRDAKYELNMYFHALLSEQKTIPCNSGNHTNGAIWWINHDNFIFILDIQMTTFLKEYDDHRLSLLKWWLVSCQKDADYGDFSILSTCHTAKKQFIHHNFLNPRSFGRVTWLVTSRSWSPDAQPPYWKISDRHCDFITGAPPEVFLPVLPSDGWRVLPADLQLPADMAGGRAAG